MPRGDKEGHDSEDWPDAQLSSDDEKEPKRASTHTPTTPVVSSYQRTPTRSSASSPGKSASSTLKPTARHNLNDEGDDEKSDDEERVQSGNVNKTRKQQNKSKKNGDKPSNMNPNTEDEKEVQSGHKKTHPLLQISPLFLSTQEKKRKANNDYISSKRRKPTSKTGKVSSRFVPQSQSFDEPIYSDKGIQVVHIEDCAVSSTLLLEAQVKHQHMQPYINKLRDSFKLNSFLKLKKGAQASGLSSKRVVLCLQEGGMLICEAFMYIWNEEKSALPGLLVSVMNSNKPAYQQCISIKEIMDGLEHNPEFRLKCSVALLDKYIQDSRSSIAQTLVPQLIPQCCYASDDRYCCVRGFIVCEDHNRALCEKHYKEEVDPTLSVLILNQTNCPCNKLPPREKYTLPHKTQSPLFLLHYNFVEDRDSPSLWPVLDKFENLDDMVGAGFMSYDPKEIHEITKKSKLSFCETLRKHTTMVFDMVHNIKAERFWVNYFFHTYCSNIFLGKVKKPITNMSAFVNNIEQLFTMMNKQINLSECVISVFGCDLGDHMHMYMNLPQSKNQFFLFIYSTAQTSDYINFPETLRIWWQDHGLPIQEAFIKSAMYQLKEVLFRLISWKDEDHSSIIFRKGDTMVEQLWNRNTKQFDSSIRVIWTKPPPIITEPEPLSQAHQTATLLTTSNESTPADITSNLSLSKANYPEPHASTDNECKSRGIITTTSIVSNVPQLTAPTTLSTSSHTNNRQDNTSKTSSSQQSCPAYPTTTSKPCTDDIRSDLPVTTQPGLVLVNHGEVKIYYGSTTHDPNFYSNQTCFQRSQSCMPREHTNKRKYTGASHTNNSKHHRKRSKDICRNFLSGKCKSKRCRFVHPVQMPP